MTAEMTAASSYVARRDPSVRGKFALIMGVAIAVLGYVMMTISSSPTVKGASFLWLPAALQLAAGVWLGPWYGFLAGGLGAYAAGILAYGGWGPQDLIQNLIAGGFANAMLPAILFNLLRVDPTLGAKRPSDVLAGAYRMLILVLVVLGAGMFNKVVPLPGPWSLALPFVALVVGARVLLSGLQLDKRSFLTAIGIAVFICAVSAFIGALGAMYTGKTLVQAIADPGIGWFVGDTVSAILGLYLLPLYPERLRAAGIIK